MDFAEWAERLSKFIDILESNRERVYLEIVSDMQAIVQNRVINERVGPDGQAFGQYSRAVVPYWFYRGKETKRDNQNAVNDLLERVGYFASYADWREVNNLTGDDLNFSFTGDMWKSMKTVVAESKEGYIQVGWVFDDPEKDQLMVWHLNRFPDLLDLSPDELHMLDAMNEDRINEAAKEAGLM